MPATYTDADFARIAGALRAPPEAVAAYASHFEAAAFRYPRFLQKPLPQPPAALRKKAAQIRQAAYQLLDHLDVDDLHEAADGPGEPWIGELLGYADGADDISIARATERIGRLAEIFDAIEATKEIGRYAGDAEGQVQRLADALGIKGHTGDRALEISQPT